MRQAGGHARRFAVHHVSDWVVIPAYSADQFAADHPVAAMEREALPACVEYRLHFAIVAAREDEAKPLARVIGVTEKLRATGSERGYVDGDVASAAHHCAVRGCSKNKKRGACGEHHTA